MDFDYREEYLKGVYQTKYYYDSIKKSTFPFSSDLQIDKKINQPNVYHRTLFTPKEAEIGSKYLASYLANAKGFFQIHPAVSGLNVSNNISAQVRVLT